MRRLATVLAAALSALALLAGPAFAANGQSPVRTEMGGEEFAHPHYVVTPQGCKNIHGPLYFIPGPGPHLAAFASSGFAAVFEGGRSEDHLDFTRGPWHDLGPGLPTSAELC